MATLRSVLETASGLYRETHTGQRYQRQDLLAHLPAEALDAPVHIQKVGPGIYHIELETVERCTFELYSRRRGLRPELPNSPDDT